MRPEGGVPASYLIFKSANVPCAPVARVTHPS